MLGDRINVYDGGTEPELSAQCPAISYTWPIAKPFFGIKGVGQEFPCALRVD